MPMNPEQGRTAVTGVIVAGGQSRRMGGSDKGLLMLGHQPLVAWVAAALSPQTADLLIVANRHLDDYRAFGYPVIQDLRGGFPGPLAGLEAALSATRRHWILSCPVDAPHLPPDYAQRMLAASRGRAAVAMLGERMEPLHALLPRTALPGLRAFLAAGGRKTSLWLESLNPVKVPFDDCAAAFADADTPEDLDALATGDGRAEIV